MDFGFWSPANDDGSNQNICEPSSVKRFLSLGVHPQQTSNDSGVADDADHSSLHHSASDRTSPFTGYLECRVRTVE